MATGGGVGIGVCRVCEAATPARVRLAAATEANRNVLIGLLLGGSGKRKGAHRFRHAPRLGQKRQSAPAVPGSRKGALA